MGAGFRKPPQGSGVGERALTRSPALPPLSIYSATCVAGPPLTGPRQRCPQEPELEAQRASTLRGQNIEGEAIAEGLAETAALGFLPEGREEPSVSS